MIVDRRTYNIEHGRLQKALKLLKAEFAAIKEGSYAHPYRIYVSRIGQFSQVAVEWEFENLAEQGAFWTEWRPTSPEFMKNWFGLQWGEIRIEAWDLMEGGQVSPVPVISSNRRLPRPQAAGDGHLEQPRAHAAPPKGQHNNE
jgi:hypothetical protein